MKSAAAGLFFFPLSLSLTPSLSFFFFARMPPPRYPRDTSERRRGGCPGGANEALGFLSTSLPIIVWRRRGRCRPSGFNFLWRPRSRGERRGDDFKRLSDGASFSLLRDGSAPCIFNFCSALVFVPFFFFFLLPLAHG